MDINPINIVLHAAWFVALLVVLKFLYVEPVLRLLRKRDELTKGRAESTTDLAQQITELKQHYESAVRKTKEDLEIVRQEQLARVRKESDSRLKQAQRELDQKFMDQYRGLTKELESVRTKLPQLAENLSQEIKRALLETKVVKSS